MNVDLRDLMRERSAFAEAPPSGERVAQVHRRIAAVRRRRAAGAVCAAVAVVAAGAVAWNVLPGEPTPPRPAQTTMRTIDGFPEYSYGARVIATGVEQLPRSSVSVTVVPDSLDLVLATRCDAVLRMTLSVDGRDLYGSDCNENSEPNIIYEDGPAYWTQLGLAVGQPATFTMTVTESVEYTESGPPVKGPLPTSGAISLAVMQRVPFVEFPLPPRPSTLAPIPEEGLPDGALVLTSDPADPLRPVSGTFVWSPDTHLRFDSQTPGYLTVVMNGVQVAVHEEWTFEVRTHTVIFGDGGTGACDSVLCEEIFPDGEVVTVTVQPEHVTGAWRVAAYEQDE
jgi:hypothetical protein